MLTLRILLKLWERIMGIKTKWNINTIRQELTLPTNLQIYLLAFTLITGNCLFKSDKKWHVLYWEWFCPGKNDPYERLVLLKGAPDNRSALYSNLAPFKMHWTLIYINDEKKIHVNFDRYGNKYSSFSFAFNITFRVSTYFLYCQIRISFITSLLQTANWQ